MRTCVDVISWSHEAAIEHCKAATSKKVSVKPQGLRLCPRRMDQLMQLRDHQNAQVPARGVSLSFFRGSGEKDMAETSPHKAIYDV